MTDGSEPRYVQCGHDWRIINTIILPMYGPEKNPLLTLKCRRCGAETEVQGQAALRRIVNSKTKK